MPRAFRWEAGLRHEVKGGFPVQLDYVGNKSYRFQISRNPNALPDQYLSASPFRDNAANSFLTAAVPNPFYGLQPGNSLSIFANTTIARSGPMCRYPEFSGETTTTYDGYSWYHSLQLGARSGSPRATA